MLYPYPYRAWDRIGEWMVDVAAIDWENGRITRPAPNNYTHLLSSVDLVRFTGRFDRDKTPVYEGDVVSPASRRSNVNYEVYWDERVFQFRLCAHGDRQFDKTHDLSWVDKVIGNKFKNPELLGEPK